jgi:hypothetical protein
MSPTAIKYCVKCVIILDIFRKRVGSPSIAYYGEGKFPTSILVIGTVEIAFGATSAYLIRNEDGFGSKTLQGVVVCTMGSRLYIERKTRSYNRIS